MEVETEQAATRSKDGGTSWWNAWLPPDIRAEEAQARAEHEAWFAHVVAGFARSLAAGHLNRSGRRWVRAAQTHVFDLHRPVGSDETRVSLLQLLYEAVTNQPDLDPTLQTKWASVLTRLFKKWKDLAGAALTLPWRPLYDVLVATHFRSLRQPVHSAAAVQTYRIHNLVALARKATRFFPAGAAQEIIEELRPYFCPHDNASLFKAQALLCLFLPSSSGTRELIDSVFDKWNWIDHSGTWDANWLSLLSRFAKVAHSTGQDYDWSPHLPQLFTHVLRILDVSTAGASKLPKPGHHSAPKEIQIFTTHEKEKKIRDLAKLLVFILTPSQQSHLSVELQLLSQLFRSIESYYHPSNSGGWSDRLALFLHGITHYYAERVGTERNKAIPLAQSRKLSDIDHEALIRILDEPMKQAIYGKGSIQNSAMEALRHLSYIRPDLLFPTVLKRIYSALESLTATHQTLNAISTLVAICHPLFNRTNYPAGVHHLPQLLRLTLPGIDPNDRTKTMTTYGFYIALFSNISLFETSNEMAESGNKRRKQKKDDSDSESAVKEAATALTEWSLELLNSLFSILQLQDKPGSEHSDQNLRRFFQKLVELFFQQASPSLYASLSKKLLHHVTYNVNPNATKEFGYMVAAASLANPDAALKSFVPLLYKKLIKTNNDTSEGLKDLSDEERRWYLHLLASVVKRTGPAVVPHINHLRTVIDHCFATKKKATAKEAGKLLKNVLRALCEYYPTDYRSVSPSLWSSAEFEHSHWRVWGKQGDRRSPTVAWHQPSAEEVNVASQLISSMLPEALEQLKRYSANPSAIGKDELWVVLQQLRSGVRGAATILPQEKGQQPDRDQWDAEFALRQEPPLVTYPQHLRTIIDAQNGEVRQRIGHALSDASGPFGKEKADDIKSLAQLIKLMDIVLNSNGISQDKLNWRVALYKGSKQRFAKRLESIEEKEADAMDIEHEAEKPEKRHYRRILVDRAHIEYLRRLNQTNWRNEAGDATKQLMRILYHLGTSGSGYAEVRKKSQRSLQNTWRYRPFARHFFVQDIITKLGDRNVTEDELKGNAFLLCNRSLIRLIAREWRYLAAFMISISSSHVHSNEKLQTLLYQLFILFSVSAYPLPLRAATSPSRISTASSVIADAADLPEEALRSAAKDADFHTKKNEESYANAVRDLVAIAEDPALHWRYQVITTACMLFLLRPDPQPSMPVVRLFLRGTLNELQPMRVICRKALSIVLKIFKPAFPRNGSTSYASYRRSISEAQKSLSADEWTTTSFVDNNWEGWNEEVIGRADAKSQANQASADGIQHVSDELASFFSEPRTRELFLHYYAQDHHVRADEGEEKMQDRSFGSMAKQFSSMLGGSLGKFVQSALGGGLGQIGKTLIAQAATEVLREVLKEHKRWPYVVNKVPSAGRNSFIIDNAQVFKGLVQLSLASPSGAFARAFDAYVKSFLDSFLVSEKKSDVSVRLHAGDQERNHALASEIMAGSLRCLKYGEFYEKSWAYWIPFLREIIAYAPMDCVRNWLSALRFSIYNLDVRRVVPLGNLLVAQLQGISAEAKKEGDSLHDAKILQFIQPFLAETSWRATAFNMQVLQLLPTRIASPFKQVREELAHLLTIIFRNLWRNPTVTTAAMDSLSSEMNAESFFASVSEDVYRMKATDSVHQDDKQKDAMEEEGTARHTSEEDISHARETLLLTLSNAVRKAGVAPASSFTHHFIRVLFASLADPDRDTVNVAKQCAALAAQVILPERRERFSFLEHILALPRPDSLWHIRAAMLPFLQIFLFNHRFLLAEDEVAQVKELVISMLNDTRVEVQELASGSLSSILHGEEDASVESLAKRFLGLLGKPLTRRTLKGAPDEKSRHGAALGLAAIVQSVPYTVPSWLPELLVQLAPYEDDAHSSVKDALKKAFAEFKRTHQEAWELHQEAFTEDQLAIVSAMGKASTSYYL